MDWNAIQQYLPLYQKAAVLTVRLGVAGIIFAIIIGLVCAVIQYDKVPVLRQIARFYIWVIRGTPLLVQLFIIFYGLPSVGIMLDAFPAAVIAFAFNEGAYCAETMRGALESVPQGQLEAGYCVGMSWWQIMRRIVLPQALRTAVPALSNSLIGMIKDTSLASNITVAELFMAGQRVAARTYIFLPIYCEVAVVYLLFCTVITKLQALLERQLNARAGLSARTGQAFPQAVALVGQQQHLDRRHMADRVAHQTGRNNARIVEDNAVARFYILEHIMKMAVRHRAVLAVEHHHPGCIALLERMLCDQPFRQIKIKI